MRWPTPLPDLLSPPPGVDCVLDIDESELAQRLERLRSTGLGRQVGMLVTRPEHVYYLTGLEPSTAQHAALLVSADDCWALWPTPERPGLPSWFETELIDPWQLDPFRDASDRIAAAAARLMCRSLRSDGDSWPLSVSDRAEAGGPANWEALTRSKSSRELAVIQHNVLGNDFAFEYVRSRTGVGSTDLQMAAWAAQALGEWQRGPIPWAGNIAMGTDAADHGHHPRGYVLQAGDAGFVDLYSRSRHYVADTTRSFCIGLAPEWATSALELIVRALGSAVASLWPGAAAVDIDRQCRSVLEESGSPYHFPHHTGHGVGLYPQERPFITPRSMDVLQTGDVVAIEPGLYFPGVGGLRVEEMFAVSESGPVRLGRYPHALSVCSA